jgi:hypothetical protein
MRGTFTSFHMTGFEILTVAETARIAAVQLSRVTDHLFDEAASMTEFVADEAASISDFLNEEVASMMDLVMEAAGWMADVLHRATSSVMEF